jgi:hypothetical protein
MFERRRRATEYDFELALIAVGFDVIDFCDVGNRGDRGDLAVCDPTQVSAVLSATR